LKITSFAILDALGTENVFALSFDTLKHRFIDFSKVVFKMSRREMMNFQGRFLKRREGTL
jgi:hypothetical protein